MATETRFMTTEEHLADEAAKDAALVSIRNDEVTDARDPMALRLRALGLVEWLQFSDMNGGGGQWIPTADGYDVLLDIDSEAQAA